MAISPGERWISQPKDAARLPVAVPSPFNF
jgi:hypothetical protein